VSPAVIVAVLTLIALALRFYKLGEWNFEATEMFTLRDSVRPQFRNSRPLGYLLNYYLVYPLRPLDEFGLRLLPAVFGVLAVPVFYWTSRRLVGTRAALFGTFLLTFSALHVFYSQFARYWSLVFLLCAVYPYALYLALRERDGRALILGLVTCVLAVLAHPVSVLLLGGLGAWFLATYFRRDYLKQAWSYRSVRWGMLAAVFVAAGMVYWVIPLLQGWISMHDKNPQMGQFLLRAPVAHGLKQIILVIGYAESLTLPVFLGAAAGIYLLWRERDRNLALLLTCLAVAPILFIALISFRTPASLFYLLPTAPVFFIGAGVFLDRLFEVDWKLRPRWLMPATLTIVVVTAGAPTLVSQYRNGRRFDFRGAADWIETRAGTRDVIYSDQPMVLDHYLEGPAVQKLQHNTAPLQEAVDTLRRNGGDGTLWVVAPAPAHAFRTNLRQGGLAGWLYTNCQLSNLFGRGRVDFRQQYLQVYRCPPASEADPAAAGVTASSRRAEADSLPSGR
jgi:4-amino-4-deoxy-L-arabinose transferase-like glycosyltransferase